MVKTIETENIHYAGPYTATTITDSCPTEASRNYWIRGMKYVTKTVYAAPKTEDKGVIEPAYVGPKTKKKECIPMGAHMPNIHPSELVYSDRLSHRWCVGGDIGARLASPYTTEKPLPTTGKPFCMVCRRFLSKGAILVLKDNLVAGLYRTDIDCVVGFGLLVVYLSEGQAEDYAAEPPHAEDNEW